MQAINYFSTLTELKKDKGNLNLESLNILGAQKCK